MLERVFPLGPLTVDDPDAALCDANFAMTFDLEMRGFRPGSTFGFTGTGGFWDKVLATAPSEVCCCMEGLRGWLNICPARGDW